MAASTSTPAFFSASFSRQLVGGSSSTRRIEMSCAGISSADEVIAFPAPAAFPPQAYPRCRTLLPHMHGRMAERAVRRPLAAPGQDCVRPKVFLDPRLAAVLRSRNLE